MCLSRLEKFKIPKSRIGYKWMRPSGKSHWRSSMSLRDNRYETRQWLDAVPCELRCEGLGDRYEAGFHILLTKKDALVYSKDYRTALVRVRFEKVTATGRQWNARIIVAKRMKILGRAK